MTPGKADARVSVLQIVPSLDAGGAERTTIDIARALNAAGFRALVASEGGRLEQELLDAGGELRRMRLDKKNPWQVWRNATALSRLIAQDGVSLVHARSRAPAWSALIAARRAGVPFVTTYHGIYNANNALKRWYNSVMVRGNAVIANSQWTAQHIRSTYRFAPESLTVIPRGIDLSAFDPAKIEPAAAQRLRQSWGAHAEDRVILLPGRLTRWKGQLIFIRALQNLRHNSASANFRAVIAGDAQGRDGYARELRDAIGRSGVQDRILLSPHISRMPLAYAAADIVVSASTDPEAFGRVPPEAAAMGRPVIATDHGGARETVIPGISGFLVSPGDAGALARALADLLGRSPAELAGMGQNGRAHVRANFSLQRMQDETLRLYRLLLQPAIVSPAAGD